MNLEEQYTQSRDANNSPLGWDELGTGLIEESPREPLPSESQELPGKMEGLSIGSVASFLLSPISALGDAAIAPVSNPSKNPNLLEAVGENFQTSGQAFMDALFPTLGQARPDYGSEAAKNLGLPEETGITLEMLMDPTITLGIPAIKAFQKGAKSTKTAGVWNDGVRELMGVHPGQDPVALTKINALSKQADSGDPQALQSLLKELDTPEWKDAASKLDAKDFTNTERAIQVDLGGSKSKKVKYVFSGITDPNKALKSVSENSHYRHVEIPAKNISSRQDLQAVLGNVKEEFMKDFNAFTTDPSAPKIPKDHLTPEHQLGLLEGEIGRTPRKMEAAEAFAYRNVLDSSARDLIQTARNVSGEFSGGFNSILFQKSLARHKMILEEVTGVTSDSTDLLLKSYNMPTGTPLERNRTMNAILDRMEKGRGRENIGDSPFMLSAIKEMQSSKELNPFVEKGLRTTVPDAAYELFVNSILSGPVTHAINLTSNSAIIALQPVTTVLEGVSAVARKDIKTAKMRFGEAEAQMKGIALGVTDTLKLISRQGKPEELIPEKIISNHELMANQFTPKITSENLALKGPLGSFVDFTGKMIRLPGNALLAEDKAFKLINYRMEIGKQAYSAAHTLGRNPEEVNRLFNQLRYNPTEGMVSHGVDIADYNTFTNELGDWGRAARSGINRIPGLRWMIPFVQTPTNIVKYGTRHSVVGNVFIDAKKAFKMNAEGDLARAKIALGTMVPLGLTMFGGDNMVGAIDRQNPLDNFRQSRGQLGYSFKVGDKFISYEKIEPIRPMLGMMVNYWDAMDNIDFDSPDQIEIAKDLGIAIVAPFLDTMSQNYMLPQMGEIVHLLETAASASSTGDLAPLERQVASMAAAMTIPNLISQTNSTKFEDTFRSANGYVEKLMQRIPGVSQVLPGYVNLWGEPQQIPRGLGPDIVSPIPWAKGETDSIDEEIIRLEVSLPKPRQTIEGIQLTSKQKHEYNVAVGKGFTVGGQTVPPLKDILRKVIESDVYKNMPEGGVMKNTGKSGLILNIISQQKSSAASYMVAIDDQLRRDIIARKKTVALENTPAPGLR